MSLSIASISGGGEGGKHILKKNNPLVHGLREGKGLG